MGITKIEWCDFTFNPWWGCTKVSDGCKFCYAESMDNRWQGGHWGPGSTRREMSESYWKKPLKWNKDAEKSGKPAKVFCASMADVFEGHPDTIVHLQRLFILIENTPHLIWQLLTKRPENILELVPDYWKGHFPTNVWIGTSVENQAVADQRIPYLLQVPSVVKFLSCEPLLGPLDLTEYMTLTEENCWGTDLSEKRGWGYDEWSGGFTGPSCKDSCYDAKSGIDWVIAGGESGHHARPVHPDWVRSLRDQCQAAGVAYFFKQWGEWIQYDHDMGDNTRPLGMFQDNLFRHGNIVWDYRKESVHMAKVGKKLAGRLLDGKEYNEFPL